MEPYGGEPKPSIAKAVIIGGIVGGILSVLPFLSAGNFCCCLWYALAGVIAVLVYKASSPFSVTTGTGALLGLVSGIVTGLISGIISVVITLFQISPEDFPEWKENVIAELQKMASSDQYGGMQEVFDTYINLVVNLSREALIGYLVMIFIIGAIIGTIASVIAGIITAAVAGKKQELPEEPPPYQPM